LTVRPQKTSGTSSGERAITLTAGVIAAIVGGTLSGEESTAISEVAPISRAGRHQLTFLSDARYAGALETSKAGIVLITPELADTPGAVPSRIVVEKPQVALLALLPRLYPEKSATPFVDPTVRIGRGTKLGEGISLSQYAVIGDNAEIGDGVRIGAHCVIGDGVTIGAGARLYPGITLYSGSVIGARAVLHSGVRIGSDGFGYVFNGTAHAKIPHVGRCIIGEDVEIGANTTVDRGSIDDTVIGNGTKIDNLVQIGHNVHIGSLCLIMAQVGIAGSTRIGNGCVIAGQAGIGGHITIGDGARIAGQSGVFGDVPAGESWSGYPARPHRESLRATGALHKIAANIRKLEQLLEERDGK
jgi:UDP-3-O-[3-hydroxymyristoyl] glucosamine N-acyltransferase